MGQGHEAHPPPHVTLTTGDEVGQGAETTRLMVASKGPVGEGQGWAGTRRLHCACDLEQIAVLSLSVLRWKWAPAPWVAG